MELKIKLPAQKAEARTKSELRSKLNLTGYSSSSMYGSVYDTMYERKGYIRVASFHKVNKKTKQIRDKNTGKYKSSKVIHRAHWIAYYYDIPLVVLDATKLKVEQGIHTFKFIKK